MAFVPTLVTVLTKPSEYENLAARSFDAGWRYLYGVLALLMLFFFVAYWAPTLYFTEREVVRQAPELIQQALDSYPPELVTTIQDGKLSINQPGPIHFDLGRDRGDAEGTQHVLTIDPAGTVETYASYRTLVLVTEKSIIMPRSGGRSLQVLPLDQADDLVIDQAAFDRGMDRVASATRWIPTFFWVLSVVLLFLVPLLGALFWSVYLMAYLALVSLVTLLIARGYKRAMDYSSAYRFGFYALTYPLIAQTVASTIGYPLPPFSFSLVFLAILVIVFSQRRPPDTTEPIPA